MVPPTPPLQPRDAPRKTISTLRISINECNPCVLVQPSGHATVSLLGHIDLAGLVPSGLPLLSRKADPDG